MVDLNDREPRTRCHGRFVGKCDRKRRDSVLLAPKAKTMDTASISNTRSGARSDSHVGISEGVFTEHSHSSTQVRDTSDSVADIPIPNWTVGWSVTDLLHFPSG